MPPVVECTSTPAENRSRVRPGLWNYAHPPFLIAPIFIAMGGRSNTSDVQLVSRVPTHRKDVATTS
jgi:hypothetical protein